jgi:hypothetical protein
MSANPARTLWLSVLALGIAAAPALAETTKPVHTHHATHAAKASKGASHEASTDSLNAQSLSAAKQGQDFTPAASAPAPSAPAAK